MKRAAHILIGLTVGSLVCGPFAFATDGTNGTSGPAMLDYDTDQVFDSQDPPHYLVVGTATYTQTGHGTTTITGVGTGNVAGTGTTGYLPKWSGPQTLGVSGIYEDTDYRVTIGNRTLSGTAQPTTLKLLGSAAPYNNLLHLDNNAPDGRPGLILSNSYSGGDWANNFMALHAHGPSYAYNHYLPNVPGKTTDAGWLYLHSMGSASQGLGIFTYHNHPIVLGTNNAWRLRLETDGNAIFSGGVSAANTYVCNGCTFGAGTQTTTTLSTGTTTLSILPPSVTNTLHAIAPAAFAVGSPYGVTDTVYTTATASSSATEAFAMVGTRTNTYAYQATYTVSGTNTFTTTATSTGTVPVTAVSTHTETSGGAVRTYTYSGVATKTLTVTATASATEAGAGTGTVSGTVTSTQSTSGTATYNEPITLTTTCTYPRAGMPSWSVPGKTFTGSGTFTGTSTTSFVLGDTVTLTSTTTRANAGTGDLTYNATGTATGSWTYSYTHVNSTSSALVRDNPTVVLVGTLTSTVLGTHTHTSIDVYGAPYSHTHTVTQVSGAVANTDTRLTNARDSTNTMHVQGGYFDVGTTTRVWAGISENATMVVTSAAAGVLALPNATKTLTGTQTVTESDIATYYSTPHKIPRGDANGNLDGWISGSTTLAWYMESLVPSWVQIAASNTWTDIMSKSLMSGTAGIAVSANATVWCSASSNVAVRLLLDTSTTLGPSPMLDVDVSNYRHLTVNGAGAFSAGTHTVKLQARSSNTSQVCRVYGGSEYTGMTIQEIN